jgi:hypothetical protein
LTANAQIAEVATGTSIFLTDLSSRLPQSVQLHGFDISADQFPQSLPPNVHLHIHDAKLPWPAMWHGCFDVVHGRLLVCAMKTMDDWMMVARNVLQLLKPGGRIQWCEGNFIQLIGPSGVMRQTEHASIKGTQSITSEVFKPLREQLQLGWSTLPGTLRDLGCSSIIQDTVSSDRYVMFRENCTLVEIGVCESIHPNIKLLTMLSYK